MKCTFESFVHVLALVCLVARPCTSLSQWPCKASTKSSSAFDHAEKTDHKPPNSHTSSSSSFLSVTLDRRESRVLADSTADEFKALYESGRISRYHWHSSPRCASPRCASNQFTDPSMVSDIEREFRDWVRLRRLQMCSNIREVCMPLETFEFGDFDGYGRGLSSVKEVKQGDIVLATPSAWKVDFTSLRRMAEKGVVWAKVVLDEAALGRTNAWWASEEEETSTMFALALLQLWLSETTHNVLSDDFITSESIAPYMRILPGGLDMSTMPLFYSDNQVEALNGCHSLLRTREDQMRKVETLMHFSQYLHTMYPALFPVAFTESECKWVVAMQTSRGWFDQHLFMLPVFDFLNHNDQLAQPLEMQTHHFAFRAHRHYHKGEQLYGAYGRGLSASDTLSMFGFFTTDNMYVTPGYRFVPKNEEERAVTPLLKDMRCFSQPYRSYFLGDDELDPAFMQCMRLRYLTHVEVFNIAAREENIFQVSNVWVSYENERKATTALLMAFRKEIEGLTTHVTHRPGHSTLFQSELKDNVPEDEAMAVILSFRRSRLTLLTDAIALLQRMPEKTRDHPDNRSKLLVELKTVSWLSLVFAVVRIILVWSG